MRRHRTVVTLTPSSTEVEQVVPRPLPAKDAMPEWFKVIPPFSQATEASHTIVTVEPRRQPSVKRCVPFADAFGLGYVQETWCDILIETTTDGQIRFEWAAGPQPLEIRNNAQSLMPIGDEYLQAEFAWQQPWYVGLPSGYSLLVTHPLNRWDLPFVSTSGVVDNSHTMRIPFGRIPFLVKRGFSGVIPVGTPMFQLIPFKVDSWRRKDDRLDEASLNRLAFKVNQRFTGWYRESVWQRKVFK